MNILKNDTVVKFTEGTKHNTSGVHQWHCGLARQDCGVGSVPKTGRTVSDLHGSGSTQVYKIGTRRRSELSGKTRQQGNEFTTPTHPWPRNVKVKAWCCNSQCLLWDWLVLHRNGIFCGAGHFVGRGILWGWAFCGAGHWYCSQVWWKCECY